MSEKGEEWAGWLRDGFFYSYLYEKVRYYFMVKRRDWAHIRYNWEENVSSESESGPFTPADLEVTKEDQIWQVIFGLEPDVYVYVYLPTDVARHGVARRPVATAALREVGHYTQSESPYFRPTFLTEHFLIKPIQSFIGFKVYNNQNYTFYTHDHTANPIRLNIEIAKCEMERIGTEEEGILTPAEDRFKETLEKLYRRTLFHRPLTLFPVRAPAKGA